MKNVLLNLLGGLLIAAAMNTIMMGQSQNQPLGDYARAVKKNKPQPKSQPTTYDNDNLPAGATLSVVGNSVPPASENDVDKDKDKDKANDKNLDDKNADKNKQSDPKAVSDQSADAKKKAETTEMKAGQSSADREKAVAAWKQKVDDQKSKTDLLARELDVTQREYQLRSNAYNSDLSNRLRPSTNWQAEDAKFKQQIADKQKSLDDAKAKLSDLQDQAHKAGVPNSAAE
jgi:hypothetical protein